MEATEEPLASQCVKSRRVWIIIAISIAGALSVLFNEVASQFSHDVWEQVTSDQKSQSPPLQSTISNDQQQHNLLDDQVNISQEREGIVSSISSPSSFMDGYTNSPPFTQCELKYLGWNSFATADHNFGDFNFDNKQLTVICKNEQYETDKHYAHIECYNTKWKNQANVCIMKNIYASLAGSKLKFKAFCKNKLSDKAIKMKKKLSQSYKKFTPIEFTDDTFDTNDNDIIDINKLNNNDVWFYDNSDQCENGKGGDKNHVGNPWHCFGHVELWFHIAKRLSISRDTHNTTIIMSEWKDQQFGEKVPIFHFHPPFFRNSITYDTAQKTIKDGKLHYIKQFILDERAHQGFGAASIWFGKVRKVIGEDKSCKDYKDLSRSPIYIEMKTLMTSYYESTPFYTDYDWIEEIHNVQGEANKFQIYGNLSNVENGNGTQWILFVATRWINGLCRYRCVKNIQQLKDGFVNLFHNKWNMDNVIIVYGNPGAISFRAQLHLFKNTKVFIGVHGAVFLMASLFMEPDALRYEILMPKVANSEHLVNMFGDGIHSVYNSFLCEGCKAKRTMKPTNIDIDQMIDKFSKDFAKSFSMNAI